MKYDFSSYVWFFPSEKAEAEVAADYILSWIAAFGAMSWIVSDQGSHFKNELLSKVVSELRTRHHFTTAYCPWANGSIKRVCREVLRELTALLSEWELGSQDWPTIEETIQSVLNHAPLKQLGKSSDSEIFRYPLEVFTGVKLGQPLLRAVPVERYDGASSEDELRMRQLVKTDMLQKSVGIGTSKTK